MDLFGSSGGGGVEVEVSDTDDVADALEGRAVRASAALLRRSIATSGSSSISKTGDSQ